MKKALITSAVALALAPTAFAQTNVTVYGIADAGVSADRTGVPGGSTIARVNSGYMSSSRFGINGSEDLGSGLKAVLQLELGYDLDTGGFLQYRGNPGNATASPQASAGIVNTNRFGTNLFGGFNRRSFVGLQGGFGTLAVGRDYTPYYWAKITTDVLGFGLYGNLQNMAAAGITGSGSEIFHRVSNALFYTSPSFGGLTFRAMASAGSESFGGSAPANNPAALPLPRRTNQMVGVGAYYVAGPLTAGAAIQQARLAATATTGTGTAAVTNFTGRLDDRRDWTVGAKYDFGAFSVGGGYSQVNPAGIANSKQAWLGGTVKAGTGRILLQWNRITQDFSNVATAAGRADTMSLAYTHPLSRRTTGYVSYGYVRNNATSAVALNAGGNQVSAGAVGADPRGLAVGLRHAF